MLDEHSQCYTMLDRFLTVYKNVLNTGSMHMQTDL